MTVETRRRNIRLLAAQWDGATGLARKLGLSGPSYISQLTRGTRPVTEKTARKLERQLDLPAGWLDRDHDAEEKEVPVDEGLMRRIVLTVGAVLEELNIHPAPVKFADLVDHIYEDAIRRKAIDEEFVVRAAKLIKG